MSGWVDDGYPTDAALTRIEKWPHDDIAACFDFVREIWHWHDWAGETLRDEERVVVNADEGDRFLRLATGGWSGNESIVSAMKRNLMIRMRWKLSAAGGLHIFEYPPVEPSDP